MERQSPMHVERIITGLQDIDQRGAALRVLVTPRGVRACAWMVAVLLVATPVLLLWLPWQQNVSAKGRVVAYDPQNRQQVVQAPVSGRVVRSWVIEGSFVQRDDPLVEIEDQDPNLVQRLEDQLAAANRKRESADEKVKAYFEQTKSLEDAREFVVAAAQEMLANASNKVVAAENALQEAEAGYEQKRLDFERQSQLAREGIVSELKAQEAERDYKAASARVQGEQAKVAAARSEESAKRAEVSQKATEATAKVNSAHATWRAAEGDLAATEKEVADAQVKLQRQKTQVVRAPRDGRVLRLRANIGAQLLKAGDPLLELIPETDQLGVELWVDGNHVPLIREGRAVRLQFEGWPAVQFSGWPSIAVGTFGGRVSLVDAQDDGRGHFRILVVPDADEPAWPERQFLRQGVRANGWVLLDQVRLGYEIWRIWSGFPPTVAFEGSAETQEKEAR